MKAKAISSSDAARKKRALQLAHGTRFWLNLRGSLEESRARGISLDEAKRRLAERLAAEARPRPRKRRRRRAA